MTTDTRIPSSSGSIGNSSVEALNRLFAKNWNPQTAKSRLADYQPPPYQPPSSRHITPSVQSAPDPVPYRNAQTTARSPQELAKLNEGRLPTRGRYPWEDVPAPKAAASPSVPIPRPSPSINPQAINRATAPIQRAMAGGAQAVSPVLRAVGRTLPYLAAAADIAAGIESGESWGEAITESAAALTASLALGAQGAAAGAAALAPLGPVASAIGGVAGGVAGGFFGWQGGGAIADRLYGWLFPNAGRDATTNPTQSPPGTVVDPPFYGGQLNGIMYSVRVDAINMGTLAIGPVQQIMGPIVFVGIYTPKVVDRYDGYGEPIYAWRADAAAINAAGDVVTFSGNSGGFSEAEAKATMTYVRSFISRADGEPDTGGNPPPEPGAPMRNLAPITGSPVPTAAPSLQPSIAPAPNLVDKPTWMPSASGTPTASPESPINPNKIAPSIAPDPLSSAPQQKPQPNPLAPSSVPNPGARSYSYGVNVGGQSTVAPESIAGGYIPDISQVPGYLGELSDHPSYVGSLSQIPGYVSDISQVPGYTPNLATAPRLNPEAQPQLQTPTTTNQSTPGLGAVPVTILALGGLGITGAAIVSRIRPSGVGATSTPTIGNPPQNGAQPRTTPRTGTGTGSTPGSGTGTPSSPTCSYDSLGIKGETMQANAKLDQVNAGIGVLNTGIGGLTTILTQQVLTQLGTVANVLNTVNSTVNTIQGFVKRTWDFLQIDRIISFLTFITVLHNAYMLSASLSQTLFSAISTWLDATGLDEFFKLVDSDDEEVDVGQVVGKLTDDFFKSIFGVETVDGIKATWKKWNRIYQAATNILNSIQSMVFSMVEILETISDYTGRIGNALKKSGVVLQNAFNWMNPSSNYQNGKFFRYLNNIQEGLEILDEIGSEVVSIQDTAEELFDQKEEFDKAVEEAQKKVEDDEAKNKEDSTRPNLTISPQDEHKAEG